MGFLSDVVGTIFGTKAPKDAARAQERSGREALAFGAEQVAPFRDLGITAAEQLPGAQFQPQFEGFNRDPNIVLNNPLFQALAGQQEQRLINQQGALGRGGSGETNDLLTQNLLQLGNQFQQQDFQTQQQEFQNRLTENQQLFGQLFNQTALGGNVAVGQATSGQDIIQGIGNARSAGIIGKQNAINNVIGQGAGLAFSDVRLKDNIEYVETVNGVNLYTWDWTEKGKQLAGDQQTYGPLAQELIEDHPDAVTVDDAGYMRVNLEVIQWH